MPHVYPIFLDVSNRPIIIVGGGAVAARKASGLLAGGASNVRAVSPKFVRDFPATVQKIVASFEPGHLEGAGLVFTATDSAAVNDAVVAEAHRRGIWVNRADAEDDDNTDLAGDFTTPALLRCGAITVAVSTGGSPALAANLRDALTGVVTDAWANLAEATKKLRPVIKSSNLPIARRREIFRAMASADAAAALSDGGMAGLWAWTHERFNELPGELPTIEREGKSFSA